MKYLITGNGSFTNGMTKRLLDMGQEVVIFSRNEKNQVETKMKFNNEKLSFVIGDVRDYEAIKEATIGIDYVLHAAAMKHIDKCEQFPLEAKKTNIDGSVNVINACIENKVKKVILLSTDKSANATTIYGLSKMFMEMYGKCVDNKDTEIISTRYGNVAGSNGSVIQIFKRLASEGKTLKITNPEITRFFMSLDEAIDLVLYALENGKQGDLFVFNNKTCSLQELADCISDNQEIVGLRCVEKIDEALLTTSELNHSEFKDDYFRVNNEIVCDKYDKPLTSDNAEKFTKEELKDLIDKC